MENKLSLDQIAYNLQTDKASWHHGYTKYYERFFEPLRDKPIVLFEAGYGGEHYPDRGGGSAKMWRRYFPNATIVVTDIHQKTNIPEGVIFQKFSQDDKDGWLRVIETTGAPDIFIDDGGHDNIVTRETFFNIFPLLRNKGIYVIEDVESSWWGPDFGGCDDATNYTANTTINLARKLINDVNSKYCKVKDPYPIESIHFFSNIVFIVKR